MTPSISRPDVLQNSVTWRWSLRFMRRESLISAPVIGANLRDHSEYESSKVSLSLRDLYSCSSEIMPDGSIALILPFPILEERAPRIFLIGRDKKGPPKEDGPREQRS